MDCWSLIQFAMKFPFANKTSLHWCGLSNKLNECKKQISKGLRHKMVKKCPDADFGQQKSQQSFAKSDG